MKKEEAYSKKCFDARNFRATGKDKKQVPGSVAGVPVAVTPGLGSLLSPVSSPLEFFHIIKNSPFICVFGLFLREALNSPPEVFHSGRGSRT